MKLGGSTVYDRMKKTGYITGSKHPLMESQEPAPGTAPGGMSDDEPMEPGSSAEEGAGAPPNLRDAKETPDSCGECVNYDGQGKCTKFDTNVTPNEVCDAFEAASEGGAPDSDGDSDGDSASDDDNDMPVA